MVCPFEVMIEQGTAPPSNGGAYLVVTVCPDSLSFEAAEEVVYQLYQVLLGFHGSGDLPVDRHLFRPRPFAPEHGFFICANVRSAHARHEYWPRW